MIDNHCNALLGLELKEIFSKLELVRIKIILEGDKLQRLGNA